MWTRDIEAESIIVDNRPCTLLQFYSPYSGPYLGHIPETLELEWLGDQALKEEKRRFLKHFIVHKHNYFYVLGHVYQYCGDCLPMEEGS